MLAMLAKFVSLVTVGVIVAVLQVCSGQGEADENTCYSLSGQSHSLNEKWDDGTFWRQCIRQQGYAYPKLMGCVSPEGKYLNSGDEFKRDGFLYKCVLNDDGWVQYKVIGCITEDGQTIRAPGSYMHGTGQITFRRGCLEKPEGGVNQPIIACKYSGPKVTAEMKVGCYAAVEDGMYFACWKPSGTSTVQTSFTTNLSELSNLRTGGDCTSIQP